MLEVHGRPREVADVRRAKVARSHSLEKATCKQSDVRAHVGFAVTHGMTTLQNVRSVF